MSDTILRLKTDQIEFGPITEAEALAVATKDLLFNNTDQNNALCYRRADGTIINLETFGATQWKVIGTNGLVPIAAGTNVGVGDFTAEPTAKFEVFDSPADEIAQFKFGIDELLSTFTDFPIIATEATTIRQTLIDIFLQYLNSVSEESRTFVISEADGITMTATNLGTSSFATLSIKDNTIAVQILDGATGQTTQLTITPTSCNVTITDGTNSVTLDLTPGQINLSNAATNKTYGFSTSVGGDFVELIASDSGAGNTTRYQLKSTGIFITLPAYDDDAAAGAGGLTAGFMYQTTGAGAAPLNAPGMVMVKQ